MSPFNIISLTILQEEVIFIEVKVIEEVAVMVVDLFNVKFVTSMDPLHLFAIIILIQSILPHLTIIINILHNFTIHTIIIFLSICLNHDLHFLLHHIRFIQNSVSSSTTGICHIIYF